MAPSRGARGKIEVGPGGPEKISMGGGWQQILTRNRFNEEKYVKKFFFHGGVQTRRNEEIFAKNTKRTTEKLQKSS